MKNILEKLNIVTIVLLLGFAGVSFMVMYHTTESNLITVDVAKIQSKNKLRVLQEVALLTAEIRNLGKDMDEIRTALNKIKENNQSDK